MSPAAIDQAGVVADVTRQFRAYEKAFMANDVAHEGAGGATWKIVSAHVSMIDLA